MDLPPIVAVVLADAAQYKRTMAEVVTTADATGKAAGNAGSTGGKMLDLMGVAAVGVGAAAVKMAGDFDLSTARIQTDGGEQASALGRVRNGILELMGQVGDSAAELTAGMNTVESAGFHAANGGLDVLRIAAEGAKVGNADLGVTANALTSDMNAYGHSADKAAGDMDQMIATVAAGKMHMQDLASSLSSVLPVAAANKVSYEQVAGALATMTTQGVSAQQGTQNLASTIRNLGNPTAVAIKTMQQLGLSSNQVTKDLSTKGLTGVLAELHDAIQAKMGPDGLAITNVLNNSAAAAQDADTMIKALPASLQDLANAYLNGTATQQQWNAAVKQLPATQANLAQQFAATARTANSFNDMLRAGNPQARTYAGLMSDMLGGQEGLNTALMLTGTHMSTFTGNVDTIAKAAQGAGGDVKDWDVIQGQFNTKLDQAKGSAEALGIRLGNTLLPVAQKLLTTTMTLVDWFGRHKTAADALGVVIGGVLSVATAAYFTKMARGLAGTVGEFGRFVGAAGGQLGRVTGFLGQSAGGFASFAGSAAGKLGTAASSLSTFAVNAGQALASAGRAVAGFALDMGAMAARAAASFAAMAGEALTWAGEMLAAGAEAILPFLPIIAIVAALGVAAYELYRHWDTVWSFIKRIVHDAFDWIKHHLDLIIDVALGPLGVAITYLWHHWQDIWNGIKTVVKDVWGFLQPIFNAISGAISSIGNGLGSLGHAVSSVGSFLGFDDGGWVPGSPGSPMLAVVHGGEFVLSRDMLAGRAAVDSGIGPAVLSGLARSSATGPAGGGTPATVTNHQVVIQAGAVLSDQDLVALVQRGFLRQGARYSTSYTPFHR